MAVKNELKAELFAYIGRALNAYGFIYKPAKDSFLRRHGGVIDIYQLVCLDGRPGLRIQPNVAIRVDQVESIFHLTSGFEAKYQKDTPTIGTSVGNLLSNDNRAYEFVLEIAPQVADVANRIVEAFHTYALPYYERFDQLAEIDKELNGKPLERTLHRVVPWLRASSGLIVAKLVGRPNYDDLVRAYTTLLSNTDKGFYLGRFQALTRSLEQM